MKPKALLSITATVLVFLLALCVSSSPASVVLARPTVACGAIAEGSEEANASCALGYAGALTRTTLLLTCAPGVHELTAVEDVRNCKLGFIIAGGPSQIPLKPSVAAERA